MLILFAVLVLLGLWLMAKITGIASTEQHDSRTATNSDASGHGDEGTLIIDILIAMVLVGFLSYQLTEYVFFRGESHRRFEAAQAVEDGINVVSASGLGLDCAGGQVFDGTDSLTHSLLHETPGCRPELSNDEFLGWTNRRSVMDRYHADYQPGGGDNSEDLHAPGPVLGVLATTPARQRPTIILSYADYYEVTDCDAGNIPRPVRLVTVATTTGGIPAGFETSENAADSFDDILKAELETWTVETVKLVGAPLNARLGWVVDSSDTEPAGQWSDAQEWKPAAGDLYGQTRYASTTDGTATETLVVQGRWWRLWDDQATSSGWCWVLTAPQGCLKVGDDWIFVRAGKGIQLPADPNSDGDLSCEIPLTAQTPAHGDTIPAPQP